jgi:hypothetical protein
VVDDGDAVGQLVGLLEVLGGEQHVGPAPHERADGVPQLDAAAGVETGGGLVEQQQAGRADEAGAEVEAAAHAPRVAPHEAPGGVGEAEGGEHVVGRPAGPAAAVAEQAGHHDQVLAAGHGRFDRGVLAGESDEPADLLGVAGGVDARDPEAAAVGGQQGGHGPHQGGLAGAVGPEDGGDPAGRGGQVEAGQGLHAVAAAAEALGQALGLDGVVVGDGVHGPIFRR